MRFFKVFLVISLAVGLHACATVDAAKTAEGSGTVKTYAANYDKTWNVSKSAVETTGGDIVEENKKEGRIVASYGVSAFSWGERVALFLKSLGNKSTQVEVVSKRAVGMNVTASNWEPKLHQKIEEELSAK